MEANNEKPDRYARWRWLLLAVPLVPVPLTAVSTLLCQTKWLGDGGIFMSAMAFAMGTFMGLVVGAPSLLFGALVVLVLGTRQKNARYCELAASLFFTALALVGSCLWFWQSWS